MQPPTSALDAAHPPRFVTRALLPTDTLLLVLYLVASILVLTLCVAFAPNNTWRYIGAVCLAVLPVGGFLTFAWLLERRISYELTHDGLWVRVRPAHRWTIVRSSRTLYEWQDIADFTTDADLLLGRYGFLEVGLRNPEETLWIAPTRRREAESFRTFQQAFATEVELLNRDDTPRAVAVAQIGRRPTLFDRRWAKLASLSLGVIVLAALVKDLAQLPAEGNIAGRVYLYLLAVPTALYCLRRSYPRWFNRRRVTGA